MEAATPKFACDEDESFIHANSLGSLPTCGGCFLVVGASFIMATGLGTIEGGKLGCCSATADATGPAAIEDSL